MQWFVECGRLDSAVDWRVEGVVDWSVRWIEEYGDS